MEGGFVANTIVLDPTKTKKKYVVWHGTMGRTTQTPYNGKPGRATSSIDAWNNNASHVGTPWLVARDGISLSLEAVDGSGNESADEPRT